MILDDLSSFIAAGSTKFTAGTNLFRSMMPPTPHTCVGIYENAGLPPDWSMGASTPTRERGRVQIVCRSTSYQTARTNMETIHVLLDHKITNSTSVSSSGPRYLQVRASQTPFPIGQDENGRFRLACNYDIDKERS